VLATDWCQHRAAAQHPYHDAGCSACTCHHMHVCHVCHMVYTHMACVPHGTTAPEGPLWVISRCNSLTPATTCAWHNPTNNTCRPAHRRPQRTPGTPTQAYECPAGPPCSCSTSRYAAAGPTSVHMWCLRSDGAPLHSTAPQYTLGAHTTPPGVPASWCTCTHPDSVGTCSTCVICIASPGDEPQRRLSTAHAAS
jgi:hypothetical protein